jgi:hypothetical protein
VNERQYRQVCEACDQVLLSPDAGDATVAIPWLHVIRPHPMFLRHYEGMFSGPSRAGGEAWRRLRSLASRMRSLVASVTNLGGWWSASATPEVRADVLFVSHLLNGDQAGGNSDFYFGVLPASLAERGYKVAVVLIDYTSRDASRLAASWAASAVPRIVLHHTLHPSAEWRLIARGRREARRLRRKVQQCRDAFSSRLLNRAAIEAIGGAHLHALRLGEQLHALVKEMKPRALVTTYEGHAWERVVYARARDASPGIRCIGYQHAGLLNMQHAALRRLGARYDPDAIACAGAVSRDALARNSTLQGIAVEAIGSVRSLVPVTAKKTGTARTACLVLPEGNLEECRLLFGLSLQCARKDSSLQFIWRLHPNMRFDDLLRQHPEFGLRPGNVEVSTGALPEDIARCGWTLYRGSTAAIQAAAGGAFPVYLSQAGEISIDTLFELEGLRARVSSAEEFLALVTDSAEVQRQAALEQIQAFCAGIFLPLDADRLALLVAGEHGVGSGEGGSP